MDSKGQWWMVVESGENCLKMVFDGGESYSPALKFPLLTSSSFPRIHNVETVGSRSRECDCSRR